MHCVVQLDGHWLHKFSTDGSNQNGTSRELARAGWGVFYTNGSNHNKASKLHGPVQISYRAEFRALLHVVKTAAERVLVMCGYKSVVNAVQDYQLHGRRRTGILQEEDLWTKNFDIMDGRKGTVKAKWMPSHLD